MVYKWCRTYWEKIGNTKQNRKMKKPMLHHQEGIIIDSESCINSVSSSLVTCLRLKPVPHPSPYKVSWVDISSIAIKERGVSSPLNSCPTRKNYGKMSFQWMWTHHSRQVLALQTRCHNLWPIIFLLLYT